MQVEWFVAEDKKPNGYYFVWVVYRERSRRMIDIGWWTPNQEMWRDVAGNQLEDVTHWANIIWPKMPEDVAP
jgi:hypothetical protein